MTKDFIQKKNIFGALFQIEITVPKYVARINESNAKKDSSNVNVEYDLEKENTDVADLQSVTITH